LLTLTAASNDPSEHRTLDLSLSVTSSPTDAQTRHPPSMVG